MGQSLATRRCIPRALRERAAPPTHDYNRPYPSHGDIHIFTTATVGVQAEIVVNIVVKASVQFVCAITGREAKGTPVMRGRSESICTVR